MCEWIGVLHSMAFVDLEEFDGVPCSLFCWSLRKLGINKWSVRAVQDTYKKPYVKWEWTTISMMNLEGRSSSKLNSQSSRIHHHSPVGHHLSVGTSLYADDPLLIVEFRIRREILAWEFNLGLKSFEVKLSKTKILVNWKEDRNLESSEKV